MRRRHVLALVILALVVATVTAAGPVRVWDALTRRTVEEYWPSGKLKHRYEVRLWESEDAHSGLLEFWYENGQREFEIRSSGEYLLQVREWSPTGRLLTYLLSGEGIDTTVQEDTFGIVKQERSVNGVVVETRTSPPWFTEEEILQSVEAVEE